MSFRRRQVLASVLTANAIRPLARDRFGVVSFFPGWLVSELAPHAMTVTAVDVALQVVRHRRSPALLALAALNLAGQAYLVDQSRRERNRVEADLVAGLGVDYVEKLDAAPTPAELATPWRSLVYPFRMRNEAVRVERDIAYTDGGKRGLLDIYLPAEGTLENAPVLLQVHGGAWVIGNKKEQAIPLMQRLAAKGWVCVAINYRLSPKNAFPAHIVDVKKAIVWIKANIASYGGDPGYLAITGGSAGGHLSSLAALTPNDPAYQPGFEDADTSVSVAVPHYGVYDFAGVTGTPQSVQLRDIFLARTVIQKSFAEAPEVFEAGTPMLRITPEAPDFFVLHGSQDTLAPVGQAREFVRRLRETSKQTIVYAELPGAQHAFDVFPSIRSQHIIRAVDRYLHWHWNGYRRELGQEPGRESAPRQP